MNTNLSLRLETIAKMVPPCRGLADIGSDHCLLPLSLANREDIAFLQAIDNKQGPYRNMVKAVKEAHMENRISLSLSNGLDCLDERVDAIVLAGMGGKLIADILTRGKRNLAHIEYILLDAHRDLRYVREFVLGLGYAIIDENLIKEKDLFYSIILFKKGEAPILNEEDLLFGPFIRRKRGKDYIDYLLQNKKRIAKILQGDISLNNRRYYDYLLNAINKELSA